jgi:6-pyruvoyltetrahydropterin/6-carboxytetrahydropterin synthase
MEATVVKRVGFSAAHRLPNYVGKCSNWHGHNWIIDLGITGEVDPVSGMVIDFGEVKSALQPILDNLDHKCVNTIIPNPTAESIALYIKDWLQKNWKPTASVKIEFIRVWETEDSYAEVKG